MMMKFFRKLIRFKANMGYPIFFIAFILLMAFTITIREILAKEKPGMLKTETTLILAKDSPEKKDKKYNIIFIVTDQERYFKNYPDGLNLKARTWMMNNGVTFVNHHICGSMCSPSRATILTGLHIPNNGMYDNANFSFIEPLSTDITTYGDMLRKTGYYTAYKGKVHLSNKLEPGKKDKYFNNGMEPYGFSDYNYLGDDYGHEHGGYLNDLDFTSDAIKWLRTRGSDLEKKKQPWFLAVNLVNPHDVMYINADGPGEKSQDTGNLPIEVLRPPNSSLYEKTWNYPFPKSLLQPIKEKGRPMAHYEYTETFNLMLGKIKNDKEHWKRYQDYYFNCIKNTDRNIDILLGELKAQGLLDKTIIVFTADHGEMAGAHGLRGKGPFAYREHINVPLIIVHPDGPKGKVCKALTSHVDLAPTMVGLSGVSSEKKASLTKGLPGYDLTPLLSNPEEAKIDAIRDATLFTYCAFSTIDYNFYKKVFELIKKKGQDNIKEELKKAGIAINLKKRGHLRTVFDGRYKYTRYFAPTQHNKPETLKQILEYNDIELFDLENDPDEMNNLGDEPEKNKELILKMNDKLNKIIKREIGKDDGSYLPKIKGVNWDIRKFDP